LSDFFPIFFAILILCIGIVVIIYLIKRKRNR
jgi:type II secretory pathway component PulF